MDRPTLWPDNDGPLVLLVLTAAPLPARMAH